MTSGSPLSAPESRFAVPALPTRVVFGAGRVTQARAEVVAAGLAPVLVLCSPSARGPAERVAAQLGPAAVGVHDQARMHVPRSTIGPAARLAGERGAAGCLAIGGGSAIGLAKALAVEAGLPYLAVPTTYSGSEMTSSWGVTEHGVKTTRRDERVRPATVLYDPELTLGLPVPVSVTSGFNALAHAAEALYAPDRSPLSDLTAAEGARLLVQALPRIADEPSDGEARARALTGSWLCGLCLGITSMGLHHKLAHVFGGRFDTPHAPTHALLLPYTLAHNLRYAPAAQRALAGAVADDDPAGALWRLGRRLGVPESLTAFGLRRPDLDQVVEDVLAAPPANPAPVDRAGLLALLTKALTGAPPSGSGGGAS
jgi:maleylacetate reductase